MAVSPPLQAPPPSKVAGAEEEQDLEPAGSEWGDARLAEAIALFESGSYVESQTLALETLTVTRPPTQEGDAQHAGVPRLGLDPTAYSGWQADGWRMALDDLATAHEDVGDPECAEALYLRMLAWREGAEQFRQGSFSVAEQLFKKSPEYKTVEDATWFLQSLRPDDSHAVPEVVGLLALGEEVAAKAAVAVWTLALRPQQRPKISECGGLELVAKAVAYHAENAELQAAGCGALRLLCTGHRLAQRNRKTLVSRLGGVEALLAALRCHPADPEVQREACGALRAAATKYPAGARRIVDGGGVALCLAALAGGADDAVGEAACQALRALQCASDAGPRAGDAAAEDVKAVVEARLRVEREAGLRFVEEQMAIHLPCGNRTALQALLGAAAVFLEDDSVRRRGLGLVGPVTACMQGFPGFAKLQAAACAILLHLSTGHLAKDEAAAKIAKSGALGPVCQAMRDLPTNGEVQRAAIGVLMNVSKNGNDVKTLGVKAGGVPATIIAMQRFPKDATLQEHAIGALLNLCDTVGRSAACARQGGLEAIVAALRRHAQTGRVAELGCIILCMFCDDAGLRQHVAKSGVVPIAKTLAKAGPAEAQRWARELLQELADGSAA